MKEKGSGRDKPSGHSRKVKLALTEVCPKEIVKKSLYQPLNSKATLGRPRLEFFKR